ncbi:MAG: putative cytosine-specific methyltransferase [Prokaryotic dsDNA virus sp.]|nr:MAG: putative cytosine-specific methyltransferase [Prokaryotic dsDNA virus sp.]|tara:strand:- start:25728 stop:26981 length:1254 start_codon:yes stop_codon:yes gene_type:complete
MKNITVLDLFSGIGGFHLGLEKAGYKVKSYYSEIDKHAIAVYKNNFKNSKYVGSITDVRGEQLPKIHAITFGSPCQDFSVAGNRQGMGGQRSSLILEAIRLIDECRPRVFIWENVKGTFSSNSGEDFASILQAFTNIGGYRLEWQLCNTAWLLPQNRERVYLVGYSAKTKRNWKGIFPLRISPQTTTTVSEGHAQVSNFSPREFGFKDTSPALLSRDYKDPKIVKAADYRNDEGLRIRENGDTPCLSARRHSEKDISTMPPLIVSGALRTHPRTSSNDKNRVKRLETRTDDISNAVTTHPLDSVVVNSLNENQQNKMDKLNVDPSVSGTLTEAIGRGGSSGEYLSMLKKNQINTGDVRRLTPVECERLQGFPDDWTLEGDYDGEIKPVSNTQRYKMCGNAVTVDVVAAVAKRIKPIL